MLAEAPTPAEAARELLRRRHPLRRETPEETARWVAETLGLPTDGLPPRQVIPPWWDEPADPNSDNARWIREMLADG